MCHLPTHPSPPPPSCPRSTHWWTRVGPWGRRPAHRDQREPAPGRALRHGAGL